MKLKVLIVNKFLYPNGGSETYIFQVGSKLQDMGHKVEYFGMEHKGRIVGNHVESYTSDMDFHAKGVGKLLYPLKIIYSTEARKKIRLVLEDFQPDVVHLNNFNFQITPSVIYEIRKWEKEQGKRVAIIYTAHDYQWVCPNHMLMIPSTGEKCFRCEGGRFGECRKHKCIHDSKVKSILGMIEAKVYQGLKTYGKVDKIICPSRFMEKKLSTDPILAGKLITLYNFLDKEPLIQLPKDDYVLYFGRYSQEKGVRTLLEVCSRFPQIRFVFAGGGPLKEELKKHPNVEDLGFLKPARLKEVISKAQFSIFPSEWYENCPFAIMETQQYGTPVIAANIGGVPELVQDKVTGILYEPGNVEQLSELVLKLWSDKELLESYTDNCLAVCFDDTEAYCRKLVSVYKEVLNE